MVRTGKGHDVSPRTSYGATKVRGTMSPSYSKLRSSRDWSRSNETFLHGLNGGLCDGW
jgi:hypothetical protein